MAELTNRQEVMEELDKLEQKDAIVELIRKKIQNLMLIIT